MCNTTTTTAVISPLVRRLKRLLGPTQASLELNWLRNTSPSPERLNQSIQRRLAGEPLQYILGSQPFGPLNLLVRSPVLIPRPETEDWVIKLSQLLSPTAQNPYKLLDLGTGSGCIPLLLCHLWQAGSVHAHGVDISSDALQLAAENAQLCGIVERATTPPQNTFRTSQSNMLSPTFERDARIVPPFDVITSNPPYISWSEYVELPKSVSGYEDPRALFGGPSGLDFYHAMARLVAGKRILKPGGVLAVEVGHDQASDVEAILVSTGGMHETEVWLDPWGKRRTVIARM